MFHVLEQPANRVNKRLVLSLVLTATLAAGRPYAASTPLYSTYFGGSGADAALATTVDRQGNLYVTGSTNSTNYPTTPDAAQPTARGDQDVFVAKFSASGTLVYSTYLGGSGLDEGRGIAVDSDGNMYVLGFTESADFPTANAFDASLSGNRDVFLAKLSPAGSILFSTFVGGSGTDSAKGLTQDVSGSLYFTGETNSSDYPTTVGAFDRKWNGDVDAYVTKFSSTGALEYSTFLGGPGFDDGLAITVDASGNAFVTGKASPGFPVTAGAYDTTQNGDYDMFVTKLNASGSALLYSTYVGGNTWDEGLGIAVDSAGNAYITGNVTSYDYPVTPGAYQTDFTGFGDAAITKLNPGGSALVYSTLLAGSTWTEGDGLAIDADGNAYIAGHLGSTDYPTTSDAAQPSSGGGVDGFVAKINSAGTKLLYSSYVGGSDWDGAFTFALDGSGNVYLAGATSSANFPVTNDAAQGQYRGGRDVLLTKLQTSFPADATPPTVSLTAPADGSIVSGNSVVVSADAFDAVGVVGVQFKLDGNNLGVEDTSSPYEVLWNSTDAANGSHTLMAIARDAAGNTTSSSVTVTVTSAPACTSTFGRTSTYSWASSAPDQLVVSGAFFLPESGDVCKMSVYIRGASGPSAKARAVIYASSSGNPTTLLGTSTELTIAGGQPAGWVTFTFDPAVSLSAGSYWLGFQQDANGRTIEVSYGPQDSGTKVASSSYSAGAPGVFPPPDTHWIAFSIYATYTPAAR